MTPAARIAAAIEILDRHLDGEAAEKALTQWARGHRFAGSGDRAAIRDHVFEALRCRRSFAALGGAMTGRGLMIGRLRAAGTDPAVLFDGQGHAPPVLGAEEPQGPAAEAEQAALARGVALDCPDWLLPEFDAALGDEADAVLALMRERAPVFLRVNLARSGREAAAAALAAEGIVTRPHPLAPGALEVLEKAQRIRQSPVYLDGRVELQDAASQALVEELPLAEGMAVLDYCAGGGGKTLAMAARAGQLGLTCRWAAHDAAPGRMRDLPVRAGRAGISVTLLESSAVTKAAPFGLVLADAPCSGSGSWRRAPEAKWLLDPARLQQLVALQAEILDQAAGLVAPGGVLAYATCSLFGAENDGQIRAFLARHPGWQQVASRRFTPLDGGDGFFIAQLRRDPA